MFNDKIINMTDEKESETLLDKKAIVLVDNNVKALAINGNEDMNKINSLKSNEIEMSRLTPVSCNRSVSGSESPIERVKFEGISDDDESSMYSDESEDDKLPPIPDGGFGWVVVVAAFLTSACADGMAFTFGLLHEEFNNYFETTQSKTSLIGSLFIATPLIAGPIMSALVDRFGCRMMTMIAGLLSAIGFLLAAVSNSVEMLCLTFGFLSGLAMGILYVTAVVSVAFWFDKKRNFAVSLASCGIGFGTLIYSPMTNYFLQIYDWRNTIVLLAGTLLHMCVCGALMREPEWLKIKHKKERQLSKARSMRSSSAGSVSSRSVGGESVFLTQHELQELLKSGESPEYILATLATTIAEAKQLEETTQMNAELQAFKRMHSDLHLPTYIQQREKVPVEVINKLMSNKRLYNIIIRNYPDLITRRRSETNMNVEAQPQAVGNEPVAVTLKVKQIADDGTQNKPENDPLLKTESQIKNQQNKTEPKTKSLPNKPEVQVKVDPIKIKNNAIREKSKTPDRIVPEKPKTASQDKPKPRLSMWNEGRWLPKIASDQQYLKNMPLYRNTIMHRGAMLNIPRYKLRATSLPDIYRNSVWSLGSESDDEWKWYNRLWRTVKTSFDFRMFTEFHFLMFNMSALVLSIWFIVPYFFLTSYMTAMHMEGAATMISIIGVASSVGIILLGWAGDQPWVNVPKIFALSLIICGLSVAAYPIFITNFWALTVISAVFGLSFASSYSYTPTMLMELMPLDQFTVAYGLILFSEGVGHLVGPPLAGLLYDLTENWEAPFYTGGFFVVISGFFIAVIAYTKNFRLCGKAPLLKQLEKQGSKQNSISA